MLKAAATIPVSAGANAAADRVAKKHATFMLIHGAWHGGWCYARVADILRAKGHRVYAPTLTGLGERSHLANGGVNCSTHIQDILNVMRWEQLHDVILCGHSYGGMIIGGVADRIPERISSLVYLDAIIPENGMSMVDLMKPEAIASVFGTTADYAGQLVPPAPAATFNVNPADRAMVDALCTPQPIATWIERLKLTGAHMSIAKKVYVLATGWKNTSRFHARVKDNPAWSTFEVPCGHDVMLDAPERLAEILLNAMP